MEKYVEKDTVVAQPVSRPPSMANTKLVGVIVLVLVVGAVAFLSGMQFQKSKTTTTANVSANGQTPANGQGGYGRRAMNGGFGTVTAVSSSSITLKNDRSGASNTYSIGSDTTVTNSGAAAAITDIAVGDTVIVRTSSSTSTTATSIMLNPSFGGRNGAPGQTQSDPQSDSQQSTGSDGSST